MNTPAALRAVRAATAPLLLPLLVAPLLGTGTPDALSAQGRPTVQLSSDVAEIPFRFIDNRVAFNGTVNGSQELVFVLDTGARASAVFGPIGDSLGLSFVGQARVGNGGDGIVAPVAIGGTIQLGPSVEVGNEMIVAMLDQDLSHRLGFAADGITGAALFTNSVVGLDFERGIITAYRTLPEIPSDAAKIPVTVEDGGVPYTVLDVELADGTVVEAKVVVDLGQGQSMSLNVGSAPGIKVPDQALYIEGFGRRFDGSQVSGHFGRIAALRLGEHTLNDVIASFPDAEGQIDRAGRQGSIGAEILRRFHVVFDYGDGFMYLSPNAFFDDPFDIDMSGLRLTSEDGTVRVEAVAEGSPGAEAGLQAGDEIVEVDGQVARWTLLPEIRQRMKNDGRAVQVVYLRNGAQHEATVRLRRRI